MPTRALGGPDIGPYKNDVYPLIKNIRDLARTKLKSSYDYNAEQKSALDLIGKQNPNGNKQNRTYKNSRYEQGINKQHVVKHHIINERDAETLRKNDGRVLTGDILNQHAPFARTGKIVKSCGIGDWCKFIENIDFDAEDIRVFEVKGHNKKTCSSIKISVPYKGEIIVLDQDSKLHFINDDTDKFAVFVIDLYDSQKFWVVSTIYLWAWIDTSTPQLSQASTDTVPSQTKPSPISRTTDQSGSTKTEIDRSEYENQIDDEDDSEDYPDSKQTSPDT